MLQSGVSFFLIQGRRDVVDKYENSVSATYSLFRVSLSASLLSSRSCAPAAVLFFGGVGGTEHLRKEVRICELWRVGRVGRCARSPLLVFFTVESPILSQLLYSTC